MSVIAEIKKENIISQAAFAKAGYRFCEKSNGKIIYKIEAKDA